MGSTEQFCPGSSCGQMLADDAVLEGWSGQDISDSFLHVWWLVSAVLSARDINGPDLPELS